MTVLLVPFWRQLKLKLTLNIFTMFYSQNCKKIKYHFLTFLPVTWVKIVIQKRAVHQMNGWNLYFLAYLMCNIQKLNLRCPRTSNITVKFIASPFSKMRQIKKINAHYQQPRKDSKQIFLKLISNQSIYSDNLKKV